MVSTTDLTVGGVHDRPDSKRGRPRSMVSVAAVSGKVLALTHQAVALFRRAPAGEL